jgi:hypothetical protein
MRRRAWPPPTIAATSMSCRTDGSGGNTSPCSFNHLDPRGGGGGDQGKRMWRGGIRTFTLRASPSLLLMSECFLPAEDTIGLIFLFCLYVASSSVCSEFWILPAEQHTVNRRFAFTFDLTSDGWNFSAIRGTTSFQRCSHG